MSLNCKLCSLNSLTSLKYHLTSDSLHRLQIYKKMKFMKKKLKKKKRKKRTHTIQINNMIDNISLTLFS